MHIFYTETYRIVDCIVGLYLMTKHFVMDAVFLISLR